MSLLKYNPALVRRNIAYPTVKGQLGVNPPVPGAEEVEVFATRSRSTVNLAKMRALAVARQRAAAARGLGGQGFDWQTLVIDPAVDITKTVLSTRSGSFQTTQTIDPKTGAVLTSTSGRQPTNFALPLNLSTSQTGVQADAAGGLMIVGGVAILLVLLMSNRGGGGRR